MVTFKVRLLPNKSIKWIVYHETETISVGEIRWNKESQLFVFIPKMNTSFRPIILKKIVDFMEAKTIEFKEEL